MKKQNVSIMKNLMCLSLCLYLFGCIDAHTPTEEKEKKEKKKPHSYGGWYCPDNLNGFPPVDIKDWQSVPVIEGRLPTKEEVKTEASLIYVDKEKHPNAKAFDMALPQLALYNNEYSKTEEYIIIIQAVEVEEDTIVGFRYLNGGNGSAYLSEVNILSDDVPTEMTSAKFIKENIQIKATQDEIWKVITSEQFTGELQPVFDINNALSTTWKENSNINFNYVSPLNLRSSFANKLFGCWYVQNDYWVNEMAYVEKVLLLENKEQNYTELKVVMGPLSSDFENQSTIIKNWVEKVKALSENE